MYVVHTYIRMHMVIDGVRDFFVLIHIQALYIHTHTYTHACRHTYADDAHTHAYIHACIYIYIYIYIHTYAEEAQTHAPVVNSMWDTAVTYTHTHTHAYTHAYIRRGGPDACTSSEKHVGHSAATHHGD